MSTEPTSHDLPDVGDQNVERLVSRAYHPEAPEAEFVQDLQTHLQETAEALAAARAAAKKPAGAPPGRLRWAGFYGVAAGAGGLLLILHALDLPGTPARFGSAPDTPKTTVQQHAAAPRPMTALAAPRAPQARAAHVGETIRTMARERLRWLLPDGSVLYVDADTELHVDGGRHLTLKRGEVFLEVSPRPADDWEGRFVIQTPQRQITALGTKFMVRADRDETGVVVTQGKVRVSDFDRPVEAGQELEVRAGRAELRRAARASYQLAWAQDLVRNAEPPLVPPSPYTGGALLVVDRFGQEMRLDLRRFHIDVYIEDGFARTTIDQTYFNPNPGRLEGTFYFPLPPDASLSRLAMYVDGKLREGGMAERLQARAAFESIVSKSRDPALLEWIDGNTFRMRVFPLEPRQEKRIILSYTQRLPRLYGRTRYVFPAGHSMDRVIDWSFHARVKKGGGLRWTSPTHALRSRKTGGDLFLDGAAHNIQPEQDVILSLEDPGPENLQQESARFGMAVQKGDKGQPEARYLMLRYRPVLEAPPRRQRRDWIILFEASADRNPLLARTQIEILRSLLGNAEHDDRFCVLTASTRVRSFAPEFKPATGENVRKALAYLEQTHLTGALDLENALQEAARWTKAARDPYLIHLGSGLPSLGERREQKLAALLPEGVPYVGVAVGKRWGRSFMKAAADRTGGHFTQINPDDSIAWRTFDLMAALKAPRLLNIRVTDDTGKHSYLTDESSLSQGEELCAIAQLPADGELPRSVTVRGLLDGKPFAKTFPVKLGPKDRDAGYLPRTWARLEIDRLLAEDQKKNHDRIVELSKSMYVMSPFTSLLVLENDAMDKEFKIDFGRKDHWAPYDCPKEIAKDVKPAAPQEAVTKQPARKPNAAEVLKTIVVRVPPRWLVWDQQAGDPLGPRTWMTAAELYSGVFAMPGSLKRQTLFRPIQEGEILNSYQDQVYTIRRVPDRKRLFARNLSEIDHLSGRQAGTGDDDPLLLEQDDEGNEYGRSPWGFPVLPGYFGAPPNWVWDRLPGGLVDPGEDAEKETYGSSLGFHPPSMALTVKAPWLQNPNFRGGIFARGNGLAGIGGFGGLGGLGGGLAGIGGIGGIGGLNGLGDGMYGLAGLGGFGGIAGISGIGGLSGIGGITGLGGLPGGLGSQVYFKLPFPAQQFPEPGPQPRSRNQLVIDMMELDAWLQWGLGGRTMLYERPSLRGDERIFKDLTLYAPGLNTTEADILAVLEAETDPAKSRRFGTIDPGARALIDKARRTPWHSITVPASRGQAAFQVVLNGEGRFAYERTLTADLKEQVVCDGRHLWHLYPEIGLGARREMSRFHRAELSRLVPWLLPPAEDLALGADVRRIAPRTVAVIPLANKKGEANSTPQVHLIFSEDGRLAERRLVELPSGKVLCRETYNPEGVVRRDVSKEKPAMVRLALRLAKAPNLKPKLDSLVIVPMPLRTTKFIERSPQCRKRELRDKEVEPGNYKDLTSEAAIALLASASFTQQETMSDDIYQQRFQETEDFRLGFMTLTYLTSGGKGIRTDLSKVKGNAEKPLGKYLGALLLQDQKGEIIYIIPEWFGGHSNCFLGKLAAFRQEFLRWTKFYETVGRKKRFHDSLEYMRGFTLPLFRWALLDILQRNAGRQDSWIFPELARQYGFLTTASEHPYEARYEQARCLTRAGQTEQARRFFGKLFQDTLAAGKLPRIDTDFYRVFHKDGAGRAEWTTLFRQASSSLSAAGQRRQLLALAWQCHELGDKGLADQLFARALADVPERERLPVHILAVQYLGYTRQYGRADDLMERLLKDWGLAGESSGWRLAATLAEKRGCIARATACLERALDMEYAATRNLQIVWGVQRDYGKLLQLYERQAGASLTLGQELPRDFTDRVVRAADRWRLLEGDDFYPCLAAGRVFLKVGDRELAWEYLTSPVAGMGPDEPGAGGLLATVGMILEKEEETELAERAYAEAVRAAPSDPEYLWFHAMLLQKTGKNEQARRLMQEIVEGKWPAGHETTVIQAQGALNRD